MNVKKTKNGVKAVKQVFTAMQSGEKFYGWELKKRCVQLYPELKNVYIDSLLREMRRFCKDKYKLVNKRDSLYERL